MKRKNTFIFSSSLLFCCFTANCLPSWAISSRIKTQAQEELTSAKTERETSYLSPYSPNSGGIIVLASDFALSRDKNIYIAQTTEKSTNTPITNQLTPATSAETLGEGEVIIRFSNRFFFIPGSVQEEGTAAYNTVGFSYGISDEWELIFDYQQVDSGSPGIQGDFDVDRSPGESEIDDITLAIKHKIWQDPEAKYTLGGMVALSFGDRGFRFRRNGRVVDETTNQDIIPSLHLPFSAQINEDFQLTVSPTVAFFADDSAVFLSRLPGEEEDFGTTFGFTTAISYRLSERLNLWADAFIPLFGNNSISRASGKPDTAIAYNAGIRYLVNPRLGIDVFATNTLGNTPPLALTADKNFTALGANVVVMPEAFPRNRRYSDSFDPDAVQTRQVSTNDGLDFFDGTTLPSEKFLFTIRGGNQGIMSALRYGVVTDLEVGIYVDYIFGEIDESEQGFSGKIRLLNQEQGSPFTASIAATVGITNQPFVNFFNNDRDRFDDSNLDKEFPFFFATDDIDEGRLFLVTISAPLHYEFETGAAVWLTPIISYVQREGTELAGFNVGGSLPVDEEFSLIAEVGANFTEDGNAFIGDSRENEIPWTLAVRWHALSLFGDDTNQENAPTLEIYLTNRVGSSTWHQLRVRDQNRTAVGVGLSVPF